MAFTIKRRAARVVLLDASSRVLLLEARDPADRTKGTWWEIPGGGVDPQESTDVAARRELLEETGITDAEIGPCVWVQHARFKFAGYTFDQFEHIHVAWCDSAPQHWEPGGLEALEALAFTRAHWWHHDDVVDAPERFLPVLLPDHLGDLVAGRLPTEPIDITHPGHW